MLPYAMGAADEIGNGPFQDPCCCRHLAQACRILSQVAEPALEHPAKRRTEG